MSRRDTCINFGPTLNPKIPFLSLTFTIVSVYEMRTKMRIIFFSVCLLPCIDFRVIKVQSLDIGPLLIRCFDVSISARRRSVGMYMLYDTQSRKWTKFFLVKHWGPKPPGNPSELIFALFGGLWGPFFKKT